MCMSVIACGIKYDPMERIKNLKLSVIAEDNLPEKLLSMIEEKKTKPFYLTFQDQGFLYICIGYGEQEITALLSMSYMKPKMRST